MSLSKLHDKCEKCKHKNNCDNKRMAACGVMASTPSVNPNIYVSINIGDIQVNTSLEEDMNKQLKKELDKRVFCGFDFDELRRLK